MKKWLGALALSGVLMSPIVMSAKDHKKVQIRIYDRDRRDYHDWNDNEERAYRHWLEQERHRQYRAWKHMSKREQREYMRWRHDHSDWR